MKTLVMCITLALLSLGISTQPQEALAGNRCPSGNIQVSRIELNTYRIDRPKYGPKCYVMTRACSEGGMFLEANLSNNTLHFVERNKDCRVVDVLEGR